MAKLFPEWISKDQREANPKFRAEFKFYDALERQLTDDWYVFYSRTWTWVEDVSTRVRMREADFIIAHAHYGILLIEVKGGRIDVKDGKWLSTDSSGKEWSINPYEQVAIAVSSLERRLNEERSNPFRNYRFSTAVCFPDVDISANLSHLDIKHQQATIDARRIAKLQESIIDVLKDSSGNFASPGEGRILALKTLVACSWYINAPKSIQIKDTENEIKRLTDSQFKLLYQVAPMAHRLLVTGCAGSGKTMLAAETARRMVYLAKKKVLFTCFNRNLATWIRNSSFFADNGLMMVSNYHKLCADFARSAGIPLPTMLSENRTENDPIFSDIYPNLLLEIAAKVGAQFDAIIVDEGQDFLDMWWTSLFLLLKDNGCMHVYYDTQQQLRGALHDLPAEVTYEAITVDLTENVRNTKSIHNLAMRFHPSRGKGYKALCGDGIDPEFVPMPPERYEHEVVRDIVKKLVENEKVLPSDIAILTPLSLVEGSSNWHPGKTLLGRFRLVHNLNPSPNEIFCSSISAAKGLEFSVVILTELYSASITEKFSEYMTRLYVGVSRARSHLIIVGTREKFESLFTQSLNFQSASQA